MARSRIAALSALTVLLAACEPDLHDSARDPCRSVCRDASGEHILVHVPSDRIGSTVAIELNPCVQHRALPDGAPVVVVLAGGFKALVSPVEPDERVIATQQGVVALYPSFATTAGDFVYEHVGDYRGSGARWAAEAALQYAAGELADTQGCLLEERIAGALSGQAPWVHGQSNGGNLAIALLADDTLSLPELAGVTTFETPASAQFVTLEVGSADNPLPLYQEGSCSFAADEGLTCALDYDAIAWDPNASNVDGHRGLAFFDLDDDGVYDEGSDSPVWGIRPEVDGERWIVYSPSLTAALWDADIEADGLLSVEEALSFWSLRDASLATEAAMQRYPDLPFLVMGTERDHNLGVDDHAHISGLAHALMDRGASWVRINPDARYLEIIAGLNSGWDHNPANIVTWPGDPSIHLLPNEADVQLHTRDYVTAGLLELMHRRWRGAWQDELDGPLLP